MNPDGTIPVLFEDFHVKPDDLAIRENTVASLTGSNRILVPTGEYDVYVSRGLEWSVVKTRVQVGAGTNDPLEVQLSPRSGHDRVGERRLSSAYFDPFGARRLGDVGANYLDRR